MSFSINEYFSNVDIKYFGYFSTYFQIRASIGTSFLNRCGLFAKLLCQLFALFIFVLASTVLILLGLTTSILMNWYLVQICQFFLMCQNNLKLFLVTQMGYFQHIELCNVNFHIPQPLIEPRCSSLL